MDFNAFPWWNLVRIVFFAYLCIRYVFRVCSRKTTIFRNSLNLRTVKDYRVLSISQVPLVDLIYIGNDAYINLIPFYVY